MALVHPATPPFGYVHQISHRRGNMSIKTYTLKSTQLTYLVITWPYAEETANLAKRCPSKCQFHLTCDILYQIVRSRTQPESQRAFNVASKPARDWAMSDPPKQTVRTSGPRPTGPLETLASQVLHHVATDSRSVHEDVRQKQIAWICDAVATMDPERRERQLEALLSEGLSVDDFIDDRIPAAARALGQRWRDDTMSFADVTIAVSRLQAMLRDIPATHNMVRRVKTMGEAPIAVIVPHGENHTLGAIVVTNQLRREGHAVRLMLGQSNYENAQEIVDHGAKIAMISASVGMQINTVQQLVETIRRLTKGRVPIAVGGSILTDNANVKARTGADVTSTNPREALSLCEQMIPSLDAALSGYLD